MSIQVKQGGHHGGAFHHETDVRPFLTPTGDRSENSLPLIGQAWGFMRRVTSNLPTEQFQNFLSEDGIKETFRQMVPRFPEKDLQKGTEWKDSAVVKNLDGNQIVNLSFMYEGVVNRKEQQLEHFILIGKLDLPNSIANSNLDFQINAQKNKSDIYFDNTASRMVDSQTTQTLTITATDNDRQAQRVVTTESKIAFNKCDP